MEPLRLLFVIDNLRPGGAQKALLALCRALRSTRATPTVWRLGGSSEIEGDFREMGVPVLGGRPASVRAPLQVLALSRYIRHEPVALVQTFLFHSDVAGRAAAWWAARRHGRPLPVVVSSIRATNRRNRPWQFALERWTARWADAFTAVSARTLEFAVEHEGVVRERAVVIPNGIDVDEWSSLPSRAEARSALGLPPDAWIVGTVGRLHVQKGHRYLIEAAAKVVALVPDALFVVAGYGPERRALEARARGLGVADRIRFLGYRSDVRRVLAALDAFVLASLWEGMSNAVLEAMAAGLPVVATAVDGNLEQVADGETGLLIPPADAGALAGALLRLHRDRESATEMGRRGRERVARDFTLGRMVDDTLDLYARLLEQKAGISPDTWRG